jgi:hypothetical protein
LDTIEEEAALREQYIKPISIITIFFYFTCIPTNPMNPKVNDHICIQWPWGSGAEQGLFVRGAKINITRYNICFNLLYMSCKTKPA